MASKSKFRKSSPALLIQQDLLNPDSALFKDFNALILQGAAKRQAFACEVYQRWYTRQLAEGISEAKIQSKKEDERIHQQALAQQMANNFDPSQKHFSEAQAQKLEETFYRLTDDIKRYEDVITSKNTELETLSTQWDERQKVTAINRAEQCMTALKNNLKDLPDMELNSSNDKELELALREAYQATSPAKILLVNPDLEITDTRAANVMVIKSDVISEINAISAINQYIKKDENSEEAVNIKPSTFKQFVRCTPTPVHIKKDVDETVAALLIAKQRHNAMTQLNEAKTHRQNVNAQFEMMTGKTISLDDRAVETKNSIRPTKI